MAAMLVVEPGTDEVLALSASAVGASLAHTTVSVGAHPAEVEA
jgi:hypothetical protein